MNDARENPRFDELLREIEEDLTAYTGALERLARPSTAQEVVHELARTSASTPPAEAGRRRLDQLVADGRLTRARGLGAGDRVLT